MENDGAYTCPSFSSYSSNRSLAEIAVRVVATAAGSSNDAARDEDNDEEFQFALVRGDDDVSAEEFARGGRNGVVFPVFDRDLLLNSHERSESSSVAVPMAKLLIGDDPTSCSSSEADELENIPAGTYCVWRPKAAATATTTSRCKKSKSTGSVSNNRWKFCDLLRSNSEGKDNIVFLTPKNHEDSSPVGKGKGKGAAAPGSRSAHEELYVLNRAIKEGNKKKSYLPYKRDLVGIFVNVNGMGKTFPHF